ncbi:hypothetical protein BKA70DRAFT_1483591 [Coprinopsis sp. MPI-PUGE-AT-0042]|nr:hypothetical protein BKA70DRAFT_1483591 [Coprinopsis sp. MPI-PUGE-AT-0042]
MPNLRAFMLDEHVEEVAHHSPQVHVDPTLAPTVDIPLPGRFRRGIFGIAWKTLALASPRPCDLKLCFLYGAEKEALRLAPADGLGRFLRHDSIGQHIKSLDLFYLDFTSLTRLNRDRPALLPSLGKLRLVGCNFSSSSLAAFAPGIHTLQLGTSHIQRSGPLPSFATLLDSSAFDPKTLRCLRLGSVNWDEATSPLAPLKAAGLKSITFLRHPVGSLPGGRPFSQASPSLRFMNVSLQAMSVDEARLCIFGVPSALARLPLQYVSLSVVDHDHFLSRPEKLGIATEPIHEGIAISWAKEIPSLRHMDVRHQYSLMSPNVTHSFMIERQGNSVSVRGLGIYPAPRARES